MNVFLQIDYINSKYTLGETTYDRGLLMNKYCVRNIHEFWLAGIYPFANPEHIPKVMADLEVNYLKKYTPCQDLNNQALADALGIIYVELIIIHPFREGNGRAACLLANLMALQAGKDIIDYTPIDRILNQQGYNDYQCNS